MKTMIKLLKVALSFVDMTPADVLSFACAIYAGMNNNPAYPNPPVDMPTFKAAIDGLQSAITEAARREQKGDCPMCSSGPGGHQNPAAARTLCRSRLQGGCDRSAVERFYRRFDDSDDGDASNGKDPEDRSGSQQRRAGDHDCGRPQCSQLRSALGADGERNAG